MVGSYLNLTTSAISDSDLKFLNESFDLWFVLGKTSLISR